MKSKNPIMPPNNAYRKVLMVLLDLNGVHMPFASIQIFYKLGDKYEYFNTTYQANCHGLVEIFINEQWQELRYQVIKPNGDPLLVGLNQLVGGLKGQVIANISEFGYEQEFNRE